MEGEGIDLKELESEVEKLLHLLKNPQPGTVSWHTFLATRLENLYRLASKALGK